MIVSEEEGEERMSLTAKVEEFFCFDSRMSRLENFSTISVAFSCSHNLPFSIAEIFLMPGILSIICSRWWSDKNLIFGNFGSMETTKNCVWSISGIGVERILKFLFELNRLR